MLVLNNLIEFLKQEGVSAQLVEEVRHYSEEHTVDEALKNVFLYHIFIIMAIRYGKSACSASVWQKSFAGRREGNGKKCACTESCSSF